MPNQESQLRKIRELEARIRLREGLPHLYGWKWYKWAREFFESKNRFCLLTAGNQLSKSSTQIRKSIHWATEPSLWPVLWPTRPKPQQFWYMYPSSQQATSEYETKWQEFLPRNEFRNHPQYGWKPDIKQKEIKSIVFNSGVRIYFKTYTQKDEVLQSSTVHYIATDEEVPVHLYHELIFRLRNPRGHFSSVFTATLGQDFWRRAMEPEEQDEEVLPSAFKKTVSAYDCLTYDDGSPTPVTIETIKETEESCGTHDEILRRVHGRFIKAIKGRKFGTFDMKKHVTAPERIPFDWDIYSAVDGGSGGEENHPAAILFIAVNPEKTRGRVFKAWRGDGIITSAGDVYEKYCELRKEVGRPITMQFYDPGYKDFDIISTVAGDAFAKADKSHERGEEIVNTVFKFGMLTIDSGCEELRKLAIELATVPKEGPKKKKKDDLADACRYCAIGIPWAFDLVIKPKDTTPGETDDEAKKRKATENRFGETCIVLSHDIEDGKLDPIEEEFRELGELLGY